MDGVRAQGIVRVVVGFDGSDDAAEAVRWAASLTRLTSSTLRVVWAWKIRDVWDTTVAARESGTPSLAEMEVVARQRLKESIAALIGDEVPDVEIHVDQGPDAAGLVLHAATDADVLVVGSRGRGRTTSALLGSVSSRCVREAACPVLVIPRGLADRTGGTPGPGGDQPG
jgi:nucleotide-binding universal stress UspA family protein